MNLTIDINLNLRADGPLLAALRALVSPAEVKANEAKTTTFEPARVASAPDAVTHLPRPEPVERELGEKAAARMLDPEPVPPTPIPDILRNTTLHPVTQEALAAMKDPIVTLRAIDAVGKRDADFMAAGKPVPVKSLTPTALAKPSRTVKAAPVSKPATSTAEGVPHGWITLQDAVIAYRRSYPTMYSRATSGSLASVKVGGRIYVEPPAA